MSALNLAPYQLVTAEKVEWVFPETSDIINQIKSKSLRSFLRTVDSALVKVGISYSFKPLDKEAFLAWLPAYQKAMAAKNHRVIADETWFDSRTAQGSSIEELGFVQEGRTVASALIKHGPDKNTATLAFKFSEDLPITSQKNSSLGTVVDYFFLREMKQRGKTHLSSGKSRNLFGHHNTIGYLEFKLKMGYQPHLCSACESLSEVTIPDSTPVVLICLHTTENQNYLVSVRKEKAPEPYLEPSLHYSKLPYTEILL